MNYTARLKRFFNPEVFVVQSSLGRVTFGMLFWPMMFETLMSTVLGTLNTLVLSEYSDTAVAAVGSVNSIFSMIFMLCNIMILGSTVVICNAIGAEDEVKARKLCFTMLSLNIGISIPLSIVAAALAPQLMSFMNLTGEVHEYAVDYFVIRILALFINIAVSSFTALLRCYGHPRFTFIISIVMSVVNLLTNAFVVYCPQLTPVHGAVGIATATVLSHVVGLTIGMISFFKLGLRMRLTDSPAEYVKQALQIIRIGLPSTIASASVVVASVITTSFVAEIGDYALSAKVYYTNILSYAYLFSYTAGSANALLVGRLFGAGGYEQMEQMNRHLCRLTRVINLAVSLFLLLLCRPLVGTFTDSAEILTLALPIFLVDIVAEQARAISQVYEYSLKAVGDVWFTLWILIASCWVCAIGIPYLLGIRLGWGLIGCWIGTATDELVRAVVTYFRWQSGRWNLNRSNAKIANNS